MFKTIQDTLITKTKLPSSSVKSFLDTFPCALLEAAATGHAKTPLFRLSRIKQSGYKPNMNPCSRLSSTLSLMPVEKGLVDVMARINKLPGDDITELLSALMSLAKTELTKGDGVYVIPNTVKMEAKSGIVRITSLDGIKSQSKLVTV